MQPLLLIQEGFVFFCCQSCSPPPPPHSSSLAGKSWRSSRDSCSLCHILYVYCPSQKCCLTTVIWVNKLQTEKNHPQHEALSHFPSQGDGSWDVLWAGAGPQAQVVPLVTSSMASLGTTASTPFKTRVYVSARPGDPAHLKVKAAVHIMLDLLDDLDLPCDVWMWSASSPALSSHKTKGIISLHSAFPHWLHRKCTLHWLTVNNGLPFCSTGA